MMARSRREASFDIVLLGISYIRAQRVIEEHLGEASPTLGIDSHRCAGGRVRIAILVVNCRREPLEIYPGFVASFGSA